jgi:hypothetical protein
VDFPPAKSKAWPVFPCAWILPGSVQLLPAFVPSFIYQAGFLLRAQHDLGSCARLDLASGLGFRVGFPAAGSCLIFHLSHRGFVSPVDLEPRTIRRRSVCPELWSSCGFWSRAGVRARLRCFTWIPFVPAECLDFSLVDLAVFCFGRLPLSRALVLDPRVLPVLGMLDSSGALKHTEIFGCCRFSSIGQRSLLSSSVPSRTPVFDFLVLAASEGTDFHRGFRFCYWSSNLSWQILTVSSYVCS